MEDKGAHDDIMRTAEHPLYGDGNAASAMDCTGLVPAALIDEYEKKAYEELYSANPPEAQGRAYGTPEED